MDPSHRASRSCVTLARVRLAYLSHYFPPESNAPAARVHELSRALVRLGHEVHVVTGQPNHPRGVVFPGYRAGEYRFEFIDGIHVHRVPTFPAANRGVLLRGLGYAALPAAQVALGQLKIPALDVVLATSPQIFTGLAGLAFARLRGVPFVLEVRDLWPESIVSVGALSARHPLIRALERLEHTLYRSAAGIVSVTDSFVAHFLAHGVAADAIAVIKNGADLDLFDPDVPPAPLRTRLGLADDALLVLFCGTIGMAHDVGLLARAAAIAPADLRAHFVIVGDGAGREALAAEISALGVGDRVHLLPAVPRREVPGLLAAADLSAVVLRDSPTFAGVLPSKIFEAMAMRRPILLGVRGEARALVERADAGLAFAPGDPAALVASLRDFAMLGTRDRRVMGDAARKYALTHHDRTRHAQQLAEFLERVARRGPHDHPRR